MLRPLCIVAALAAIAAPPASARAQEDVPTQQPDPPSDGARDGRGPSKRRVAPRAAKPSKDQSPNDEAAEKPAHGGAADEKPANDPADERPAEEKPAKEKPAKENAAEEKPAEEKPAKENAAEESPAGEKPAGEKPADEAPADAEPATEPDQPGQRQPSEKQPPKDEAPEEDEPPGDEPPEEEPPKKEPPPPEEPPVQKPPAVELKGLSFVGGEVARAERFLKRAHPEVAACVKRHGGVAAERGILRMQLLVRARGRAEGVEVLAREHVSEPAAACVRRLLKGRWMGSPSQDPVGVTFRFVLERRLE